MLGRLVALLLILGSLVLSVGIGCTLLKEEKVEGADNFTVSENCQVTILNSDLSGDVNVETWGKEYVEVIWKKRSTWGVSEMSKADARVTGTPATETPGNLKIETRLLQKNARVSLTYDIKLPKNVFLTNVTTGKGDISIVGTTGNTIVAATEGTVYVANSSGYMDITAGKGSIHLEGTTGGAKLTTSAGSITVKNTDGAITASTSGGKIEISDCKGDVILETSKAGISVDKLEGSVLVAKTSDAPINIRAATSVEAVQTSRSSVAVEIGTIAANGTTIITTNGSIDLFLPRGMNAEIELQTSSGDIAFHLGGICISEELTAGYFKGTMGDGGNRIYVETSKGDINLLRSEVTP